MTVRSGICVLSMACLATVTGRSAEQATAGPTFPVSVWVRVSFNGGPVPDAFLTFKRRDIDAPAAVSGPSDPKSPDLYFVRVPGWGPYVANVSIGGRTLPGKQIEITSRDVELAYTGGAIDVTVDGILPMTAGRVVVRSGNAAIEEAFADSTRPVRILPLGFGTHRVLAYDANGRVSRTLETIRLEEARPQASVTLRLEEPAEVTLRDPDGRPATPLSLSAWAGVNLQERITPLGGGRYRLAGVPAGADLRMRPVQSEWLPVCRSVPAAGQFEIAFTKGRRAEVTFTRRGIAGPAGMLSGLEGSDCAVPFSFFRMERLPPDADQSPRGVIHNFPLSRDLLLEYQGLSQFATVTGDGSVIVR